MRGLLIILAMVASLGVWWAFVWTPEMEALPGPDPSPVSAIDVAATVGPLLMLTVEARDRQTWAIATSVSMVRDETIEKISEKTAPVATAVVGQNVRIDHLSTRVAKLEPTPTPWPESYVQPYQGGTSCVPLGSC